MTRTRTSALRETAVIVVAVGAAYAGSLRGSFQFDDEHVIVSNATIRDLGAALGQIGRSTRSLVQATFALNYRFGGLDPTGYHVVNLLIHLGAALALYGWLRSLPAGRALAWGAALLFAVHPLATQSVTYVAQRYSSMAGLFFFLSLWCWSLYRSRGARTWYAASLLAALAAMLCKEMAVAIPVALLATDASLHAGGGGERRSGLRRACEYAPLAALLTVVPLLNLINRDMPLEELAGSLNWAAGTNLTSATYFLSQLNVVPFVYLRLMLLPIGLSVEHQVPVAGWPPELRTLAGAAVLIALLGVSALAAFAGREPRVRLAGFCGLLFLLGLGATSSVIPNSQLAQEQRTYVSLAGATTAACVLAWGLFGRAARIRSACVLALAGALAWGTAQRNAVWRSPESLWRDAVAKSPDSARAQTNLGVALADQGRRDEALRHYRRALQLDPRSFCALNNLGNVHFALGRTEQAARAYAQAVRLAPSYAEAHSNLGAALEKLGRLDDALASCREALRLRPDYADAHNNAGNALRAAGRSQESVADYERAIALYRRFDRPALEARACNNLANALADLGRVDEALSLYARALRLCPDYATAADNLARLRRALGRPVEVGVPGVSVGRPARSDATPGRVPGAPPTRNTSGGTDRPPHGA